MLAPRRRRGTALADARLAGRLPGHGRVRRRWSPTGTTATAPASCAGSRQRRVLLDRGPPDPRGLAPATVRRPADRAGHRGPAASIARWWGVAPSTRTRPSRVPVDAGGSTVTGAHRSRTGGCGRRSGCPAWRSRSAPRSATAHGLYEVALAAARARRDRLALPADHRRPGPRRLRRDGPAVTARRPATPGRSSCSRPGCPGWRRPRFLASGATLDASPVLRFGIGAWPAVAAAVAAHLLYLLASDPPTASDDGHRPAAVQPSSRPIGASRGLNPADRPTRARPTPATRATDAPPPTSAQNRARRRPSGTPHATAPYPPSPPSRPPPTSPAAPPPAALKPLRGRPLPLHLINTNPDDDTIEEHNQP